MTPRVKVLYLPNKRLYGSSTQLNKQGYLLSIAWKVSHILQGALLTTIVNNSMSNLLGCDEMVTLR